MLWRALKHVDRGFYIDVGAQDPVVDSVSLAFYEHGWRGVHVEPTPTYAESLRAARADETVIQAAVGDQNGSIPFFEILGTGLSTGDSDIASRHEASGFAIRRIEVPCITLSTLLSSYQHRDIHWLKIDVEGYEQQVLRSWGDCTARPWVVIVESTLPLTQEVSHSAWEPLLFERDYLFAYFDGLNRYYVASAHRELLESLSVPPNVFDGFAVNGTASTSLHRLLESRHALQLAELHESHQTAITQTEAALEALRTQLARSVAESADRERAAASLLAENLRAHAAREDQVRKEFKETRQALLVQAQEREAALEREHRGRTDELRRSHAAELATMGAARAESERRLHEELSSVRLMAQHFAQEMDILERSWAWQLLHPFRRSRTRIGTTASANSPVADGTRPSLAMEMPASNHWSIAPKVASVEELLSLDGEAFVRAAYLAVLGRTADPRGLAGLVEQLRLGVDKEQVLEALASSPEGKAAKASTALPGLEATVERVRRHPPSLLRRAIRRINRVAAERMAARRDNRSSLSPSVPSRFSLKTQYRNAMNPQSLSSADIKLCIEAVLGRTPDKDLVDYHVKLGFRDCVEFGAYLRNTAEFREKQNEGPRRITRSIYLGDRLLSYTHLGDRIFLIPTDLDLTPSILEYGLWEPHVESAITRVVKPGDKVIEAGANVGYHTLAMARAVGPHGIVHAFEANPLVMKLLRSTLFQNNFCDFQGRGRVTLHQKAMTDREGTLTLQCAPDHFGSGHLITDNPRSDFGSAYSSHFEVEAVRVDRYLAELGSVDFIHLDIEGAEPLAIKGARDLIARSPNLTILMEWSVGMMQAMAPVDEMVQWLTGLGFRFWVIRTDGSGYSAVGVAEAMNLPHCDVLISRQEPR